MEYELPKRGSEVHALISCQTQFDSTNCTRRRAEEGVGEEGNGGGDSKIKK